MGDGETFSFDDMPEGLYYNKGGKWVKPPEGKLTKIPVEERKNPRRVRTKSYDIIFRQIMQTGPVGFESTYLTEEGEEATGEFYESFRDFDGRFLPVVQRVIRQRNGAELAKALNEGKTIGIASGFKPSGAVHFGHKLTTSALVYFQRNGMQLFIPVADVEAATEERLMESDPALSKRRRWEYWAADNLLDWGACGVNMDAAHIYLQSEEKRSLDMAAGLIRSIDFDFAIDTYTLEKIAENMPFLFAGATQAGDIILPQHPDFDNYHSFMVSGPDQDGHMRMTLEMIKNSLKSGQRVSGLQTAPSAFYIPHIRGLAGTKAGSSVPESTIFIGPGPQKYGLEERVRESEAKMKAALSATPLAAELCALDMTRYLSEFNRYSDVDFRALSESIPTSVADALKNAATPEERAMIRGRYMLDACAQRGQRNSDIVLGRLETEIGMHAARREAVCEYALARAQGRSASPPSFWETLPDRAYVPESLRNRTKWYDIVNELRNDLMV